MVRDATTFFLSFAAVFGVLGWYLLRLERHVTRLRDRVDAAATILKSRERDEGDEA